MAFFSVRDEIIEVVHRLFIYTDNREWEKLQNEVFTESIFFDIISLGGIAKNTTAKEVCAVWQKGFERVNVISHLCGNHLVTATETDADVFIYVTATHYKSTATKGKTREFFCTYNLHLVKTDAGWRINRFKYNLKFQTGNLDLI
jgi:hypothetical protein